MRKKLALLSSFERKDRKNEIVLVRNILFHTQGLQKFNKKRIQKIQDTNFAEIHTDEIRNKDSEMKILVLLNGYYFLGEEWRYIDRWGLERGRGDTERGG